MGDGERGRCKDERDREMGEQGNIPNLPRPPHPPDPLMPYAQCPMPKIIWRNNNGNYQKQTL